MIHTIIVIVLILQEAPKRATKLYGFLTSALNYITKVYVIQIPHAVHRGVL